MNQCRSSDVLERTKPGTVFGTETWRDSQIKDSKIFPSDYKLHGKDNNSASDGGALIAVKYEYNREDVPEPAVS